MTSPLPKNPNLVPLALQKAGDPAGTASWSGRVVGLMGNPRKGTADVADLIKQTGYYQDADGNQFVGKEGDLMREGWTYAGPKDLEGDDEAVAMPDAVDHGERSQGNAPENKMAKGGAPENRGR